MAVVGLLSALGNIDAEVAGAAARLVELPLQIGVLRRIISMYYYYQPVSIPLADSADGATQAETDGGTPGLA